MSDLERNSLFVLVLLAYGLLCLYCAWRYRAGMAALGIKAKAAALKPAKPPFLVAYASQSGNAAALAQRSAAWLEGQWDYQILPLNKVDNEVLSYTHQALFVVSTYGDGEPPDNGQMFANRYLGAQTHLDLSHLQFSVLALGDTLYQQFCAFGHRVQQGLSQLGAVPLCEPLEACASAGFDGDSLLQQWRQRVSLPTPVKATCTANADTAKVKPPVLAGAEAVVQQFSNWQLVSRTHLNPGSPGAPVFHVCLAPQDKKVPNWQAGDLVEVAFDTSLGTVLKSQVKRKYSIASLAQDGVVELIVRRHINHDGSLGLGSGWLSAKAQLNSQISLRLCENPLFHGMEPQRSLILIGSGTGLAGLRAHIKQRAQQGAHANWLLFGERSAEHDKLFNDEIQAWQHCGVLNRVDLAFSRDAEQPAYVQDLLLKHADELKKWITQGAAIFVCGNRLGMAQGVDQALQQILDTDLYQQLVTLGYYRRDVY